MDDSLITHILSSLLPPEIFSLLDKNILQPNSPGHLLYQNTLLLAHRLYFSLAPLVQPLLDRALVFLAAHQSYVDAAVPLLFFLFVVMVMNWVRRMAMWAARLALRAVFWAFVAAVAAVVWKRGVVESARDAVVLGGRVVGYVGVLRDVWVDEYKRYEGAQETGRWDEFSRGRTGY